MAERRRFGPYVLERRLSIGGTAAVWQAHHVDAPTEVVALKRLLPHAEEHPDIVGMFRAEAELLAQLTHPGVAAFRDHGCVDGSPYLTMELLSGTPLSRIMRPAGGERPMPMAGGAVAALGVGVAEVLGYIHCVRSRSGDALQLVHRDVSPQNIMVCPGGAVSLIDFGIASYVGGGEKTKTGVVKGKYAYMSPEQVRREPLDGRSDIFSLGIVLWEAFTGRRLFRGESQIESMQRVEAARVPPIAPAANAGDRELLATIMACLEREPDARPPDGATVAARLQPIAGRAGLGALDAARASAPAVPTEEGAIDLEPIDDHDEGSDVTSTIAQHPDLMAHIAAVKAQLEANRNEGSS